MAIPKFPLKTVDGTEIRTLEELREHTDFHALAGWYEDGSLRRWLRAWGFAAEAKAVEQLDSETEGFHRALYDALGMVWTEETEADFARYIDEEIERELAAQQEEEQAEAQVDADELLAEEEPPSEVVLATPTMSDKMADEVARLMNFCSSHASVKFAETEKYILLQERVQPEPKTIGEKLMEAIGFSTISSVFGLDDTWYRYSKRNGQNTPFAPSEAGKEFMPSAIDLFFASNWEYGIYGNTVVCMSHKENDHKHLISIDVNAQRVNVLKREIKGDILSDAVNSRIAYGGREGLWLFDLQNNQTLPIKAHGKKIAASSALLTEQTLYFVCRESEGWLDDGENPRDCLCEYDLSTQKSRVLAKLDGLKGVRGLGIGDGQIYLYGVDEDNAWYGTVPASAYGNKVEVHHLNEYMRSCGYVQETDDFVTTAALTYQDCFAVVCGSRKQQYLFFVCFGSGKTQVYPLWDIKQQAKRNGKTLTQETYKKYLDRLHSYEFFRLGSWLYYSFDKVSNDDDLGSLPYERWKISLETGERVKLSSGD